jgi:mycoredoxin
MSGPDESVEIIMYGTHWCGDCFRSENLLKRRNISYRYVDIDEDAHARDFVLEVNGGYASVPTIIFPDGDILVEPSNRELEEKLARVG